jgi:hypothetical protein
MRVAIAPRGLGGKPATRRAVRPRARHALSAFAIGDDATGIASFGASETSVAGRLARRPVALFAAALLIAVLAGLALRAAPTLARASASRCASHAAHSSSQRGACAQHRKRTHVRAKRRHKAAARPRHARHEPTVHAPAIPAQQPAACEDGSSPTLGSEGFSCADGSEPACANGGEPVPARKGSTAVCPATPGGTLEWSEAECADGSTPTMALGGGYACEDGSTPVCEDGSQLVSTDGSTLACIAYGAAGPPPGQPSGEEDSEDSSVALAANGS